MKPIALANTLAIFSFLIFAICIVWAVVYPSTFIAFWDTWVHGFDLEVLAPEGRLQINAGQTLFGIVSFTISAWVSGYAIAWLYNQFSK